MKKHYEYESTSFPENVRGYCFDGWQLVAVENGHYHFIREMFEEPKGISLGVVLTIASGVITFVSSLMVTLWLFKH